MSRHANSSNGYNTFDEHKYGEHGIVREKTLRTNTGIEVHPTAAFTIGVWRSVCEMAAAAEPFGAVGTSDISASTCRGDCTWSSPASSSSTTTGLRRGVGAGAVNRLLEIL